MNRTLGALTLASVTALLLGGLAPATADDLDDDLDSVAGRIAALSAQISDATAQRSSLAAQIKATNVRMDETVAALEEVQADIVRVESDLGARELVLHDLQGELTEQYARLAATRAELEAVRDDAIRSALDSYMLAGTPIPVVTFTASAWTDLAVGIEYEERAAAASTAAAEHFLAVVVEEEQIRNDVEDREVEVETELAHLTAIGITLQRLHANLDARNRDLEAERVKQKALLSEVEAAIDEFENEIGSLQREQASIRRLIAARAVPPPPPAPPAPAPATKAADPAGSPATTAPTSAPATTAPAAAPATTTTTTAPARLGLVRPVPGAVTSGYGYRIHPIYGNERLHTGWDMNGAMGSPIVAAASGTVIFASVKGGYGNTMMIDHGGGMVTLYAHQSQFAVGYGQQVSAGQVIGYVGSTGDSTGPHLHFEVRINGTPVNPSRYL
jgi:murein DD-endopeptidase MepM/ murein hydrolase activator NlpD